MRLLTKLARYAGVSAISTPAVPAPSPDCVKIGPVTAADRSIRNEALR